MTDSFLVSGLVLSIVIIGFYLWYSMRLKSRPDLGNAVSLFLSGNGVIAGVKVCFLGCTIKSASQFSDERTYILLGGLAVIWVSIESIYKVLFLEARQRQET